MKPFLRLWISGFTMVTMTTALAQVSPQTAGLEIQCHVANAQSWQTFTFRAKSIYVSQVYIWDWYNYLLSNPSAYNNKTVQITGNYLGSEKGFDYNDDFGVAPKLRKSKYNITVDGYTPSVTVDWQGSSISSIDVVVTWDAENFTLSADRTLGPWDQSGLQPSNPYNLYVEPVNGHPYLSWYASEQPFGSKYHVWRSSTSVHGPFYRLTSLPVGEIYYTDYTVQTPGGVNF